MFCDLVGSTPLSAQLDPEDMWGVIASYHACISEVVARYQGTIARYMGDGVLSYFGFPHAQHAPFLGQGCAGFARYRGGWSHIRPSRPGWIASPICADLIYDRHR